MVVSHSRWKPVMRPKPRRSCAERSERGRAAIASLVNSPSRTTSKLSVPGGSCSLVSSMRSRSSGLTVYVARVTASCAISAFLSCGCKKPHAMRMRLNRRQYTCGSEAGSRFMGGHIREEAIALPGLERLAPRGKHAHRASCRAVVCICWRECEGVEPTRPVHEAQRI